MKDVILTIKGLAGAADDGSEIELVTEGRYDWTGDGATFCYEESELTGLEGTHTEFLVEEGTVTLTRTGTVAMQMTFREGEKCFFLYGTPAGSMAMGVDTQSISNRLGERGGVLEVRYMMDFGSSLVTRNRFEIGIKEIEDGKE